MCGITGYFSFTKDTPVPAQQLQQATDSMLLRGPDAGAVYCNDFVGLGHRRLSIIDTSSVANQPMTDASGRYVLIFNGEIFNYEELAAKHLAGKWNGPVTHSDTEVLLYLLIHYHTASLGWLSGFFAFAFYDLEKGDLLIARDRFGKKPLMYYANETYLAFASDIKALLQFDIPRNINYNALFEYLQLSYVPPPHTMLDNVYVLEAGHYMLVDEKQLSITRYYTPSTTEKKYVGTYAAAQEQLYGLLDDAVRERLIADVPIGAFLSGGIDSSTVVALASKYTKRLQTFSVGYTDHRFFDETAYAKLVADKYNTEHTVFNLGNQELLAHVDDVLDYFDQPLADPSCIPLYILCREAKKSITVGLTGDGTDEVFGGYNKHMAEYKVRQRRLLTRMVSAGDFIWNRVPQGRDSKLANLGRQLSRFAEGQKMNSSDRYWRWASISPENKAMNLLHPSAREKINHLSFTAHKAKFTDAITGGDFNEVLLADVKMVLAGNMLPKTDLMSMANSLELRSPFLAAPVVDFAFTLPASFKVDGKMKKKIVQDTFRKILPPELYNRPKHGFDVPLQHWFCHEMKGRIFDELLAENNIREQNIFDYNEILSLKTQLFSSNPGESVNTIWALVVFQYWYQKYIG